MAENIIPASSAKLITGNVELDFHDNTVDENASRSKQSESDIDVLKTRLSSIETTNDFLNTLATTNSDNIKSMQDSINNIAIIKSKIDTNSKSIKTLTTSLSDNLLKIQKAQSDIVNLNSAINNPGDTGASVLSQSIVQQIKLNTQNISSLQQMQKDNISELNKSLQVLETSVETQLNSNNNSMSNLISTLNSYKDENDTTIESINSKIDELKTTSDTLNQNLTALSSNIDTYLKKVESESTETNAVLYKIRDIFNANKLSETSDVGSQLTDLQTTSNQEITNANTQLTSLNSTATTLQTSINTLTTSMATILKDAALVNSYTSLKKYEIIANVYYKQVSGVWNSYLRLRIFGEYDVENNPIKYIASNNSIVTLTSSQLTKVSDGIYDFIGSYAPAQNASVTNNVYTDDYMKANIPLKGTGTYSLIISITTNYIQEQ